MKRTSYIVYLLLILSFTLTASLAWAEKLSGNPIGCSGANSKLRYFDLRGKVLLNQNFLPETEQEIKKLQEEAIEIQLKHLMGFFRTTTFNLNAVLASYRTTTQILKTESVKYANSFQVDDYLPSSRGPTSNSYIKKALLRGFADHSDQALLVHYQTRVLIADCSSTAFSSEQVFLPTDPFLSFWIEDKVKRKPRSYGPGKLDQVSNCTSNEIVLFGNYDLNWFFWNPISNGKNECKRDDQKMYTPSFKMVEEVQKIAPINNNFFKSKSLKVAAIFGIIDQSDLFVENDYIYIRKFLVNAFDLCKKLNSVPACLNQWNALVEAQSNKKFYEPGAYHFFNYLKYLHTLVTIEKVTINEVGVHSKDLFLQINGKLIDSKMPIEISSYYGKTSLDYEPRVSKTYLKLMHESFKHFDSISYVGHAGLGQNLRMQTLNKFWSEERLPQISRTKPLWLGIYNCEAFSYFGFDLNNIFKPGHMNVLLTKTTGTDTGSKFPLSQLSLINNLYAPQTPDSSSKDIEKVMGRYVSGRDFLTTIRIEE